MNGQQINDCITILNKLLVPDYNLSDTESNMLLYFFKEENVKSVNVYRPQTYQTSQTQLPIIREKKEKLLVSEKYDELARLRDLEKRSLYVVQIFDAMKKENMLATFSYGQEGLNLIIAEGEYDSTIVAIRKLGLKI